MEKQLKSKITTWLMLVVLIAQTLTPVASVFAEDTSSSSTQNAQIMNRTQSSTTETSAELPVQTPQLSTETTITASGETSPGKGAQVTEDEASAEDEEPARGSTGEEVNLQVKQLRAIPNDLGAGIFRNVDIKIGDTSLDPETTNKIELTDGLQLRATFDWALDDTVELSSGDWAELPLPHALQGVVGRTTGDLFDENKTAVGIYEVTADGKLKVTFNDELVGKSERAGEVGLLLEFSLKAFEEDVNQKLEFGEPINKNFDIKVKPQGEVHSLKKYGNANEKINPTYIDWRLDVNTTLEELTNGSVEDIIPAGLELDFTSIEIHELKVGSEGKLTLGDKVTPNVIETSTGFKVELGKTDKAYRITYKTNITEFKDTYKNDAVLKDSDKLIKQDSAIVDGLSQGSLIEKEGWVRSVNKDQIYWRLYVNKSESNLKDVKILDEIPVGLKVNSITAWKLVKSGNDWNYGEKVGEYTEFPVELGDIQEAYVFEIITDIDYGYFKEYTKEMKFHNIAKLEVNGKEMAKDDATVTVNRGSLITKTGKETTNYADSKVSWTITVNEAKHHINNAVITDTIGEGLEFIAGTLKVKDSAGKEITLPKDAFKQTATGFTLSLGDITDKYTITYDTKIIGKLPEGQTGYKNKATLSGGNLGGTGVGEGDLNKEPEVKPSVNNTYSKSAEYWSDQDGISYRGIDYKEKTLSWKLTIDAKKEEITELKITDHFEPEKSMKFLKDSLKVVMKQKVLKEGIDYELVDKGVDGFELEFIGNHKPLERATYEIYYKTSFDPNIVLAANGKLNEETKYTNHATYIGKTKDVEGNYNQFEIPVKADYWVDRDYVASGKKAGTLNREERTISWKIYTNASGRDLTGAPFVITDKLVAGDQTINEDVKVYEYSLKEDGSQVKGSEVTKGFTLSYDKDQKGFSVTFGDGVKVPVLVEFTSKINGKSEEWYKNQAIVTDKTEVKKTYDASVKYENYNSFVSKQALNVDGNKVYTDDEIEWKVSLNESLSDIKNAVFKDEMSKGLVLLEDSIKVYKGSISEANQVSLAKDAVKIVTNKDGGSDLTIELGNIKETRYYVTYTTVVIATDGKINNNASLFGYEENLGTSGKKEFNATQASWGTGSGKENRGQLELVKIDSETKEAIATPAEFELYYLLNGEKQVVTGKAQQTQNGKIQYGNLPFRTYYLKEVTPPEGYQNLEKEIEIIVDKDHKKIELKVENTKIPDKTYAIGDYTWVDANGNGLQDKNEKVLAGVKVELYDETGKNVLQTTTTNDQGFYLFDELEAGKYTVKFTLTTEQAKLYGFTKANVGQADGLDSDADPATGFTQVITLDDSNQALTKDYKGVKATEGIDPTWDAGVVLKATSIVPAKTRVPVEKVWVGKAQEAVTVHLFANGEKIETVELSKENNWKHTFTDLPVVHALTDKQAIVYTVEEEQVSGYNTAITGDAKSGFVITNTRKSYAIGDYTWIDANGDGLQDKNEKVLAGVKVELYDETGKNVLQTTTTNDQGFYLFDELEAGKYTVKFTLTKDQAKKYEFTKQNVGEDSAVDSDADPATGFTQVITLDDSNQALTKDYKGVKATEGIDPTWDAGVVLKATSIVPAKTRVPVEKVWVGKAEEAVTVHLFANGEKIETVELSKENNWKHTFTDLPVVHALTDKQAIVYTVAEEQVSGYNTAITGDAKSGFVITNTRKSYAIGDYTWIDANGDGLQDKNEKVLAGVKVELYDETGKNVLQTTTTNDQGFYLFDELEAGKYTVKFTLTTEQAKLYEFTKANVGQADGLDSDANPATGFTQVITLDDSNQALTKDYKGVKATEGIDPTWDAGVVLKATSILPAKTRVPVEKVWVGKAEEAVTVHLFANGEKIETVELSKENNWKHTFTDLPVVHALTDKQAIVYTVAEEQVSGYNTAITGDAKSGFVITNTRKSYAIGDYTWIDANGDGLQDAGEAILSGVKVELFDKEGNVVATTTTNAQGFYLFDELEAGDYKVKFTLTEEQAKKYEFTKQNIGEDSAMDSDANPTDGFTQVITLDDSNQALTKDYKGVKATEGIDPTWDAGVVLKATSILPAKTRVPVEKVWVGKAQEAVTVHLFANGEKIDTVELSKENNWKHTFTDLPVVHALTDKQAIVYTVEEEQVSGYNTAITGDAKSGFVITNTRKSYAIGDYTWIDANGDGLQDANEQVLPGVKVELYDETGKNVLQTTTTNDQGFYLFDELEAGKYTVKFTLTTEQAKLYEFTKANVGQADGLDSDADSATGFTQVITLDDSNQALTKDYKGVKATEGIDPTWDAGVILLDLPENPGESEKPSKPENPSNSNKPNKPNGLLPQTGDDSNPIFVSLVGLIVFSLAGTIIVKRRRKSE